jgi:type VI secretion system protein ImpM
MTADVATAPGWYGKIPYLGDFASRRLPQTFIGPWDGWLQQSIAASRTQLAARWLEVYLHSPIWRFVLLPGVIGNSLWAGLMMPSVDKVGRHFPLTLAVELVPQPGLFVAVMAARQWYAELEDAALATLDTGYPVEQFEASLAELPFPQSAFSEGDACAAQFAHWWRQPNGQYELALPEAYTSHHLVCAAGMQLFEAAGTGKSLWWQETQHSSATRLACFNGLPPADCYANLLQPQAASVAMLPLDIGAATGGATAQPPL